MNAQLAGLKRNTFVGSIVPTPPPRSSPASSPTWDALLNAQLAGLKRKITVHARRGPRGNLEIAVEDNGCGVDLHNLERIFELGFTTKPEGSGLGLHFSACAALELHGKLTAHSDGPGRGASFLLELPLDPAAAAA